MDDKVREEFVTIRNGYRHGTCPEKPSTEWNWCPRCGTKLDWGDIKRFYEGDN